MGAALSVTLLFIVMAALLLYLRAQRGAEARQ
jgi:ABC-type spermidine/putrescine transport system permease subunit I